MTTQENSALWIDLAYYDWFFWVRENIGSYLRDSTANIVARLHDASINPQRIEEAWNLIERLKRLSDNISQVENLSKTENYKHERPEIYFECAIVAYRLGGIQESTRLLQVSIGEFQNRSLYKAISYWVYGCVQWQISASEDALLSWERSLTIMQEAEADNRNNIIIKNWCSNIAITMKQAIKGASLNLLPLPPVQRNSSIISKIRHVEIKLDGEFKEFTSSRQKEFVGALALLLAGNESDIRIISIVEGSIVVVIEMSESLSDQLHEKVKKGIFNILNWKILTVAIEGREPIILNEKVHPDQVEAKPQIVDGVQVTGQAIADTPSIIDLLGYKTYVTALANFIESPKTQKPLTIGIDAVWGGGKTTLMRMLEKHLGGKTKEPWIDKIKGFVKTIIKTHRLPSQPLRFNTVWFNAWAYDKEETLWAAMALEIWSQTRKRIGIWKRNWLGIKLNAKRVDWAKFTLGLLLSLAISSLLAALFVMAFAGISLWLGKDTSQTFEWVNNYVKVFSGLGLVSIIYTIFKDLLGLILSPFNIGIARYLNRPDYVSKIGFIHEFQKDFKYVVDAVTENGKWPLAVFVDDLDRCTPDKAAEVIEAINLLLDSQHCVFVIGMDSSVLSCSIQAKYKDIQPFFVNAEYISNVGLGRLFLEKIIQIEFRIPQPDASSVSDFINFQLGKKQAQKDLLHDQQIAESLIQAEQRVGKNLDEAVLVVQKNFPDLVSFVQPASKIVEMRTFDDHPEVEKVIKEMASYLNNNPRRIKRFINMYRLQALIAFERNILEKLISLDNLAYWVLISMRWPEFIHSAIKDTKIIVQIQDDIKKLEKNRDKSAGIKQISESRAYPQSILPLLTDPDFSKMLSKIVGKSDDVENYLHLSQISISR